MKPKKRDTYFVDIDGTIFKYRLYEDHTRVPVEVLKSTKQYLQQKRDEGSIIVLTTARSREIEEHTKQELAENNIPYDILLMEMGRGVRYLINDLKPDYEGDTAIAINLERDKGI